MANIKNPYDLKQVKLMGFFHASYETMAYILGTTADRIFKLMKNDKAFRNAYKRGEADLKLKLAQAQINLALSGNAQMLVWLGRNYLGQTDTPLGDSEDDVSVIFEGWD